jgi:signal transduction histidine kinase
VAAAVVLLRRAVRQEIERARAADRALAGGGLFVAAAGSFAAGPTWFAPSLWPVALGAAGALVTAVRTPPYAPPPAREWLAAAITALVVVFAAAALGLKGDAARVAIGVCMLVVAVLALVRPLLESTRLVQRRAPPPTAHARPDDAPPLSAAALAFMAPMIDDAFLRRPGRPRVIARVPARRLLDAALDKARQSHAGARSKKDELRVEVIAGDAEVDVDGDPVELAEALCAVLDNALRLKAKSPDVKVQVQLRGGPGHVTFEVNDVVDGAGAAGERAGPSPDAPFFAASTDADRPGLGVGLARARLLVEKNGGKLLTRTTAEGSCVQLTIPRRMQRTAIGQA